MQQTCKLFCFGMRQTVRDGVLLILVPAPFMMGAFVKWGMPLADRLAQQYFSFALTPWYSMADAVLIALTPFMTALMSAFLLLDERDEGTGAYYQITPVQGSAYLLARIALPMVWAFFCTVVVAVLFGISGLSLLQILSAGLIGTGMGVTCSMMIVALAGNRVEGLAISKLTGVSLLGLVAVWFVPSPYRYIASFLPSFWMGELIRNGTGICDSHWAWLLVLYGVQYWLRDFYLGCRRAGREIYCLNLSSSFLV